MSRCVLLLCYVFLVSLAYAAKLLSHESSDGVSIWEEEDVLDHTSFEHMNIKELKWFIEQRTDRNSVYRCRKCVEKREFVEVAYSLREADILDSGDHDASPAHPPRSKPPSKPKRGDIIDTPRRKTLSEEGPSGDKRSKQTTKRGKASTKSTSGSSKGRRDRGSDSTTSLARSSRPKRTAGEGNKQGAVSETASKTPRRSERRDSRKRRLSKDSEASKVSDKKSTSERKATAGIPKKDASSGAEPKQRKNGRQSPSKKHKKATGGRNGKEAKQAGASSDRTSRRGTRSEQQTMPDGTKRTLSSKAKQSREQDRVPPKKAISERQRRRREERSKEDEARRAYFAKQKRKLKREQEKKKAAAKKAVDEAGKR